MTEKKGQCVKVMSVVCENEGEAPDQVRCDVKEGQCVKVMSVVGERNMALMRDNEMHEMEVVCSMRQTPEMSP